MHMHSRCVIRAVTVHVKMWRAAGVPVYTPRRLPENSLSGKRKTSLNSKKNTTGQCRMRIAKNSNFCSKSNRRAVPTELTRTNVLDSATGFPVTSKDRSSILFRHRCDNYKTSSPSTCWFLRCLDRCTR